MRRLVPLLVLPLVLAVPGRAEALSCVGHPDASAASVAAGTERMALGKRFRDYYDGVAFGRVRGSSAEGRDTVYQVEVTGVFGTSLPQPLPLRVEANVAGGPVLKPAEHYYFAYQRRGDVLQLPLCGPLEVVAASEVPALMTAARQGAWPETEPVPVFTPLPQPAPEDERAPAWLEKTGEVVGVLAAGVMVVLLWRRYRSVA